LKLWLARHAQPLIASGICYGATDVGADAQATLDTAQTLSLALPFGLLVSVSPLQRCELLKHYLQAFRPDLVFKTDARLVEMNFGTWEGQRWDAIPQIELENWTKHFDTHACGGAERVDQFMGRVGAVWDEAKVLGQDSVWITHAGVIRAAKLLSHGIRTINQADEWPHQAPGFGEWCVLEL
jgi:alpha-ribazole phosphatase